MGRKEALITLAIAVCLGTIAYLLWYAHKPQVYIDPAPFPQTIDQMQTPPIINESQVEQGPGPKG